MSDELWIRCDEELPPEDVVVETKIHDQRGWRNEQRLRRQGSLWFFVDDSMYVYYEPTHWRIEENGDAESSV